MAQDLFTNIKYLPIGDFTQEDVIQNDVILGKRLPTSETIFQSDKKQRIYLELWNETNDSVQVFVKVLGKIIQNNTVSVCDEENYAHTFHQIDINEGEEIFASASRENSISYNIVL